MCRRIPTDGPEILGASYQGQWFGTPISAEVQFDETDGIEAAVCMGPIGFHRAVRARGGRMLDCGRAGSQVSNDSQVKSNVPNIDDKSIYSERLATAEVDSAGLVPTQIKLLGASYLCNQPTRDEPTPAHPPLSFCYCPSCT